MNLLSSILHNKVTIFNIILVSAIALFLLIANVQQEVNIEEYATIPFDNTPILEGVKHEYEGEIELLYDKEGFMIEYSIGKFLLEPTAMEAVVVEEEVITDSCSEEDKPLPLSPATSIFYIHNNGSSSLFLSLALAVKKVTEDPAVYSIKVNDRVICYISDPFPTGYNSIIIYTAIEVSDKVRIEISKVRTLG